MESVLVLTHADESGSALTRSSLEAVTAGQQLAARLGAQLTIGIVTPHLGPAADELASAGARLLAVSGEAFAQPRYASCSAAAEALCRAAQPTIVLASAASAFSRCLAGVSHRLGGVIDTHITALSASGPLEITRWFYRQRIEGVLSRDARPWFVLLEAGVHPVFDGARGAAAVEQVSVQLPLLRTTVIGIETPAHDAQTCWRRTTATPAAAERRSLQWPACSTRTSSS